MSETAGYVLGDWPITTNDGRDALKDELYTKKLKELLEAPHGHTDDPLVLPSPLLTPSLSLRPSLSSVQPKYTAWDANDKCFDSSSSFDFSAHASSSSASSSTGDAPPSYSEEMDMYIPSSQPGVHLHARESQFIIIPPPSSSVHRVVSVDMVNDVVHAVASRKPSVDPGSISSQDIVLSTLGETSLYVVRRGLKSGKVTLDVQSHRFGTSSRLPMRYPNQLADDFSANGHPSTAILVNIASTLYLIGNQNLSHVWSLEVPNGSPVKGALEWRQLYKKGPARPGTRPTSVHGCPRVAFTWGSNIIVIGVEKSPVKVVHTPYSSPKPKSKPKKSAKFKQSTPSKSPPKNDTHSLNIWQFNIPNGTWTKRSSPSQSPQGTGSTWPVNLSACLVDGDVACVSVGRENGACIWSLDLHTLIWSPLPSLVPPGAHIHAMSSIDSTVYFMGEGLADDQPSPIVHCDMSSCEAWNSPSLSISRQNRWNLKPLVFSNSASSPTTRPPSPDLLSPVRSASPESFIPPPPHPPLHKQSSASMLPSYEVNHSPPHPMTAAFLFFTPYQAMHQCTDDTQFEKIKDRLCAEWANCSMSLMCFIAVNAATLGFSTDSTIIKIDEFAKHAISLSMLFSAIGLAICAWLYCVYYSQDGETFRHRTRDALGTYAIFSVRARIPILSVAATIVTFLAFIVHCLMNLWPEAVLVVFTISGILLGLNWFVYFFYFVRWVIIGIRNGLVRAWRFLVRPRPVATPPAIVVVIDEKGEEKEKGRSASL